MSYWALFKNEEEETLHIAPATEESFLLGHVANEHCHCRPKRELTEGWDILTHRDAERGGCDA